MGERPRRRDSIRKRSRRGRGSLRVLGSTASKHQRRQINTHIEIRSGLSWRLRNEDLRGDNVAELRRQKSWKSCCEKVLSSLLVHERILLRNSKLDLKVENFFVHRRLLEVREGRGKSHTDSRWPCRRIEGQKILEVGDTHVRCELVLLRIVFDIERESCPFSVWLPRLVELCDDVQKIVQRTLLCNHGELLDHGVVSIDKVIPIRCVIRVPPPHTAEKVHACASRIVRASGCMSPAVTNAFEA
mmetsp:Transcript_11900/g.22963  ORF Transcript_11900/g.22963 Transcript_11900/m.22963 type:complete len:244 (+) Transcript_11900:107-838(+)